MRETEGEDENGGRRKLQVQKGEVSRSRRYVLYVV